MDWNTHWLEFCVRERLAAARQAAATRALVDSRRPERRAAFRARLGVALIALGRRLAGDDAISSDVVCEGLTRG